jgi:hypothetical protein
MTDAFKTRIAQLERLVSDLTRVLRQVDEELTANHLSAEGRIVHARARIRKAEQ